MSTKSLLLELIYQIEMWEKWQSTAFNQETSNKTSRMQNSNIFQLLTVTYKSCLELETKYVFEMFILVIKK